MQVRALAAGCRRVPLPFVSMASHRQSPSCSRTGIPSRQRGLYDATRTGPHVSPASDDSITEMFWKRRFPSTYGVSSEK